MLKDYVTREELQASINQLEQAIYNHQTWYNVLIRTLICRLAPDDHDIDPMSHHHCRFGQWYYSNQVPNKISEHPGFIAIGHEHERMHQLCTQLLNENIQDNISPIDYDKFANALESMRLEIFALRKELEETLYNHDSLTGAITRLSMLPILREQQELIRRQKSECCLAMLDIDLFKEVNDKYGHIAGDQILTQLVAFCLKNVRTYDKIFRYGGEEFVFALPHTDLSVGRDMMERLRAQISSLKFSLGSQKAINITVSIGLSMLDPMEPIETSIDRADKALYHAKSEGRNCIRIWTD